ncbi:MAG: hypothetical protein MHM6MM_007344 [Cercozoa sp. M6MM]
MNRAKISAQKLKNIRTELEARSAAFAARARPVLTTVRSLAVADLRLCPDLEQDETQLWQKEKADWVFPLVTSPQASPMLPRALVTVWRKKASQGDVDKAKTLRLEMRLHAAAEKWDYAVQSARLLLDVLPEDDHAILEEVLQVVCTAPTQCDGMVLREVLLALRRGYWHAVSDVNHGRSSDMLLRAVLKRLDEGDDERWASLVYQNSTDLLDAVLAAPPRLSDSDGERTVQQQTVLTLLRRFTDSDHLLPEMAMAQLHLATQALLLPGLTEESELQLLTALVKCFENSDDTMTRRMLLRAIEVNAGRRLTSLQKGYLAEAPDVAVRPAARVYALTELMSSGGLNPYNLPQLMRKCARHAKEPELLAQLASLAHYTVRPDLSELHAAMPLRCLESLLLGCRGDADRRVVPTVHRMLLMWTQLLLHPAMHDHPRVSTKRFSLRTEMLRAFLEEHAELPQALECLHMLKLADHLGMTDVVPPEYSKLVIPNLPPVLLAPGAELKFETETPE